MAIIILEIMEEMDALNNFKEYLEHSPLREKLKNKGNCDSIYLSYFFIKISSF